MTAINYALVFGGCLLILAVGYVPVVALGAATGRFIRRICKRTRR